MGMEIGRRGGGGRFVMLVGVFVGVLMVIRIMLRLYIFWVAER